MSARAHIGIVATLVLGLFPCAARDARAQWSGDPAVNTLVCGAEGRQEAHHMISDALGRSTFVWQDARGGVTDIYAQRLDVYGHRAWGVAGIGVCVEAHAQSGPQIVAADAGGAIVVWEDARSDSGDVYAQRLGDTGAPAWTGDGIAACAQTGRQSAPAAAPDDSGGVIVAWLDRRDGVNTSVYAQRVTPDGATRWSADGVPVCTAPGAHASPAVIADGAGGAFVTWADARGGYRARRIDRDGVAGWTADGVTLCAVGTPRDLMGIRDDNGGLLVTWDRTDYSGFFRDLLALRFDGAGVPSWPDTGVVLSRAPFMQRVPGIASDGAGGAIVAWEDGRNFHLQQVFAQRVDASGATRWTTDGVPVRTANLTRPYPVVAPDEAGGAFVVWRDDRAGNVDLWAQRLDANGAARWTPEGVPVSTASDTQSVVVVASDGAAGIIVGWMDGRDPFTRTDILAARLLPDGTLASVPTAVPDADAGTTAVRLAPVRPTPARVEAEVRFTLARAGTVRLEVFDERGRRVRTLGSGTRSAGEHALRWALCDTSGRPVANGIYYVRLVAGGSRPGVRCVVLR